MPQSEDAMQAAIEQQLEGCSEDWRRERQRLTLERDEATGVVESLKMRGVPTELVSLLTLLQSMSSERA